MSYIDKSDIEIFKELLQDANELRAQSGSAKLVREIVPIETWLEREYYVGQDGLYLYDYWKDQMKDIFNPKRELRVNEIIVTGGLGCLSFDTLYWTSIGLKTLQELYDLSAKGVTFKVKTDKGEEVITKVHKKGYVRTKKVTFSNGFEVEGSLDHRFRVIEEGKIGWVRLEDLTSEHHILYSKKPEMFQGDLYDLDKSYLMGYIYGDGSVTYNNGYKDDVSVISNLYQPEQSNRAYLRDISEKYIGGTEKDCTKSGKTMKYVRGTNRELINEWEGIGNSHTKRIPNWFYTKSMEDQAQFIAGLWDSDGTIAKDSIALTLCSLELIQGVQRILQGLGINSRYVIKGTTCNGKKGFAYRLSVQGYDNWKSFYEIIPIQLDYKKEKLRSLVEQDYHRNRRNIIPTLDQCLREHHGRHHLIIPRAYESFKPFRYGRQQVTLETLQAIHKFNKEWVESNDHLMYLLEGSYSVINAVKIEDSFNVVGDIEVPNTHTYLMNGLVSHNTGKSTFALFCMLRKIYELSCYENVPALFNLMPNIMISFIYFSVSIKQAELTGFGQIKNIIDTTPYFKETFPRETRINSLLKFPENLMMLSGSTSGHSIGMNLIGAILDEANFFNDKAQDVTSTIQEYSKVASLYGSIRNRAVSRFKTLGVDHSLSLLVSSSTTASSFTEDRINAARGNDSIKVINARLWEVKPKGSYSNKYFWVFVGSEMIDPFIVNHLEEITPYLDSLNLVTPKKQTIAQAIAVLPDYAKERFQRIPVDFKKSFQDNIIMSLQDIAGSSVAPVGRLFNSKPTYFKACENNALKHPFYKDEIVVSTMDKTQLKDYMRTDFKPLRRGIPRYIHLDQSVTTDYTGLASAYTSRYIKTEDGVVKPVVSVDLMIRVVPPKSPYKISIGKVRDFVFYLRDTLGLDIGKVTYDTYQSAESLQVLEENGFNCGTTSVDRTDEAYLMFVDMLYEGRIEWYSYKPAEEELFNLVHYRAKKKIDHLPNQRKDVMDAVVGAVWNAVQADYQLRGASDLDATPENIGAYFDEEDEEVFTANDFFGELAERIH